MLPMPKSVCAFTPRQPWQERLRDTIERAWADFLSTALVGLQSIPDAIPGYWQMRASLSWSETDRLLAHDKVLEANVATAKWNYEQAVRELNGCRYARRENEERGVRAELRRRT